MCTLEPGCPHTLRGGIRPRTTLSPTIALKGGEPDVGIAFGTPGSDGQDQWSLSFFLRHVHHGMAPQQAIDFPSFSSRHFPSSFGGGAVYPKVLNLEGRIPAASAEALRERGHKINHDAGAGFSDGDGQGSVNAVGFRGGGAQVFGAANPRDAQGYCVGR